MGFLFLLLYIFTSYIFPGEIFPSLGQYHLPYWIGTVGLFFSFVTVIIRRGAPFRSVQLYFVFAFSAVMMISWVLADHWWGAIPQTSQLFGPSLTMFLMALCCVDSLRKLSIASNLIVILSLAVMIQGAIAYHFGYNAQLFIFDPANPQSVSNTEGGDVPSGDSDARSDVTESGEGAEAKRIRGLGMFHDPNDLSLGLIVALPLIGFTGKSRIRTVLTVLIPSAALCYGVFLTHSRGGALGLLVVLMLTFSYRFGRWRALLLVSVLAAGALAIDIGGGRGFSAKEESAAGRIDAWNAGFQMLKGQPLTGVGYRQFVEHNGLTAHNSFVLCFAETGLLGYFFWLGLLTITWMQLQHLKQVSDERRVAVEVARSAAHLQRALVGFMTAAFFLSRTYVPLLYMLLGLGAALVLIAQRLEVPVTLPRWPRTCTAILGAEFASIIVIYIIGKLQVIS